MYATATQTNEHSVHADHFPVGKGLAQNSESHFVVGIVADWHNNPAVGGVEVDVGRTDMFVFKLMTVRQGYLNDLD
jgi:hypothetical protein